MRQCGNGSGRELPLEADHDVEEDQEQCHYHRERAALSQFTAHLGTDAFNTTQINFLTTRLEHYLEFLANTFRALVRLRRQADQYVGLTTKRLHLDIFETGIAKTSANLLEIGRLWITHFEQNAARKVDTEIQAASKQRHK